MSPTSLDPISFYQTQCYNLSGLILHIQQFQALSVMRKQNGWEHSNFHIFLLQLSFQAEFSFFNNSSQVFFSYCRVVQCSLCNFLVYSVTLHVHMNSIHIFIINQYKDPIIRKFGHTLLKPGLFIFHQFNINNLSF